MPSLRLLGRAISNCWRRGESAPANCHGLTDYSERERERESEGEKVGSRLSRCCRYMYFFQMPYVPEIMLGCDDFKMIDGVFRGKETGVKNREMMTPDDVAIYKNALYAWGEYLLHCIEEKVM